LGLDWGQLGWARPGLGWGVALSWGWGGRVRRATAGLGGLGVPWGWAEECSRSSSQYTAGRRSTGPILCRRSQHLCARRTSDFFASVVSCCTGVPRRLPRGISGHFAPLRSWIAVAGNCAPGWTRHAWLRLHVAREGQEDAEAAQRGGRHARETCHHRRGRVFLRRLYPRTVTPQSDR
jgi:hypothetical protein